MTDFNDYKTASQWAIYINRGCADRLSQVRNECDHVCQEAQAAYNHGWNSADSAENKAGRPMP